MGSIYVISITAFFGLMFVVAFIAARKVDNAEDFIIAGRGLGYGVLIATLIATWFGAGSLTVSANAIAAEGLRLTALEPFGVGACLLIAGWFYAKRLWQAKVLTLADLMRKYFGPTTEALQIIYSISYFGWIAVQLMAIGNIFELVFGLESSISIVTVSIVLTLYTLLGGMWSVALTDMVQVTILIIGLCILTIKVVLASGAETVFAGVAQLFGQLSPEHQVWIPLDSLPEFNYWLGLFIVGALGNLATQDFLQRIFAAKSPSIAARSCVIAGSVYILIAMMPVVLGVAGRVLLPEEQWDSVIPMLTQHFLSPELSVIFFLTLIAAITSTVDSAMLGPASVFAQNFLRYRFPSTSTLRLTRYCVLLVAVCSTALALSETNAIDLLQSSYSLGIPPLVILSFGLYQKTTYALPAIVTAVLGLLVWGYDMINLLAPGLLPVLFDESLLPLPLTILLISVLTYGVLHALSDRYGSTAPVKSPT